MTQKIISRRLRRREIIFFSFFRNPIKFEYNIIELDNSKNTAKIEQLSIAIFLNPVLKVKPYNYLLGLLKKKRAARNAKKKRVKEAMVIKREYKNLTTKKEFISEFRHKPVKCARDYRVIVLKKIIDVTEGQRYLFEDSRYLFYITNIEDMSALGALRFIQGRCNYENKIEQLDNGIHAHKMPIAEFTANWAYIVICTLAWNLKSWLGLVIPDTEKKREIISCEFKSFQNRLINIPCQVLKAGRKIIFRFLNYNPWIEILLNISNIIRRLSCAAA